MKTKFAYSVAFVALFLLSFNSAQATVGGPSFIGEIRAKSATQPASEIIYTYFDGGGRGCPPEIYSLDTQTSAKKLLVSSCDNKTYESDYKNTQAKYPTPLTRIHLPYNGINADVSVVRESPMDESKEIYYPRTEFTLAVSQNGTKKATFPFFGCTKDQPHVIEGYMLPGGNDIAVLISSRGDCFEGGYNTDRLFVVHDVPLTYKYPQETRKAGTPATVDATSINGNLLVFAGQKNNPAPTENPSQPGTTTPVRDDSGPNLLVNSVIVLVGVLIGYTLARILNRKRNSPVPPQAPLSSK